MQKSEQTHTEGQDINLELMLNTVVARVSSSLSLTASTARLALAEVKLAASSAVLLLAGGILLCVMLMSTWAVLVLTLYQLLQFFGLSALAASGSLLLLHLLSCFGIVLVLRSLSLRCRMSKTRQALQTHQELFKSPQSTHPQ